MFEMSQSIVVTQDTTPEELDQIIKELTALQTTRRRAVKKKAKALEPPPPGRRVKEREARPPLEVNELKVGVTTSASNALEQPHRLTRRRSSVEPLVSKPQSTADAPPTDVAPESATEILIPELVLEAAPAPEGPPPVASSGESIHASVTAVSELLPSPTGNVQQ